MNGADWRRAENTFASDESTSSSDEEVIIPFPIFTDLRYGLSRHQRRLTSMQAVLSILLRVRRTILHHHSLAELEISSGITVAGAELHCTEVGGG